MDWGGFGRNLGEFWWIMVELGGFGWNLGGLLEDFGGFSMDVGGFRMIFVGCQWI